MTIAYSIITGAASGLGLAIATQLQKEYRPLILVDFNEIKSTYSRAIPIQGDVNNPETWRKVVAILENENAQIDLLANCAGVTATGDAEAISLETWHWVMNTNFFGIVNACHALIPFFKKQRKGKILNIASRAGVSSVPQMAPYNTSKAAIISFSETLYSELRPFGVNVTVACPSYFQSNLAQGMKSQDEIQKQLATKFIETAKKTAPQMADEILNAVAKNDLYYFPSGEDKTLWRLKRFLPKFTLNLVAKKYLKEIEKLKGDQK